MFFIEIAGLKIMFTGDYSREDDRHLVSAEVPREKPDLLICESTYGTATHMPRLEKEARLMKMTTDILTRGGRVLMPVFALGRAQELLLILDEYWDKHPQFQTYPIYYASNLARKCMDVYRTYINMMNDRIKKAMFEGEGRNPWDFRWVRSLKTIDRFEDVGGCVMLASPGMLQVIALLTPSSNSYFSSFPTPSASLFLYVYLCLLAFHVVCARVVWREKTEDCWFNTLLSAVVLMLLQIYATPPHSGSALGGRKILSPYRIIDMHNVFKIKYTSFHRPPHVHPRARPTRTSS